MAAFQDHAQSLEKISASLRLSYINDQIRHPSNPASLQVTYINAQLQEMVCSATTVYELLLGPSQHMLIPANTPEPKKYFSAPKPMQLAQHPPSASLQCPNLNTQVHYRDATTLSA